MIFGGKSKRREVRMTPEEEAVFLFIPRRLKDGRIAWLQDVWRTSTPALDMATGETAWTHEYEVGDLYP